MPGAACPPETSAAPASPGKGPVGKGELSLGKTSVDPTLGFWLARLEHREVTVAPKDHGVVSKTCSGSGM